MKQDTAKEKRSVQYNTPLLLLGHPRSQSVAQYAFGLCSGKLALCTQPELPGAPCIAPPAHEQVSRAHRLTLVQVVPVVEHLRQRLAKHPQKAFHRCDFTISLHFQVSQTTPVPHRANIHAFAQYHHNKFTKRAEDQNNSAGHFDPETGTPDLDRDRDRDLGPGTPVDKKCVLFPIFDGGCMSRFVLYLRKF